MRWALKSETTVMSLVSMETHVEEAVVVHISKHMDDVPGAEGQLSLNSWKDEKMRTQFSKSKCQERIDTNQSLHISIMFFYVSYY